MPETRDIFEVLYHTRSMRRLKPDPVPDDLIYRVLDAGIRAPSGTNAQNWCFVVVRDPEVKKQVQACYLKGWRDVQALYRDLPPPAHMGPEKFSRLMRAATYLAEHLHEVPVILVACLRSRSLPAGEEENRMASRLTRLSGSSIYPAVQNMLLACRALGLGATLTTVASLYEEELKKALGLPEDIATYALLPIGYPRGKFGPVSRLPVEEVTRVDRWEAGKPFKPQG